jgi:hypothetical protein
VDAEHTIIVKMFEKKVHFLLKGRKKRQPSNKIAIVFGGSIFKKKSIKDSFKKKRCHKKNF